MRVFRGAVAVAAAVCCGSFERAISVTPSTLAASGSAGRSEVFTEIRAVSEGLEFDEGGPLSELPSVRSQKEIRKYAASASNKDSVKLCSECFGAGREACSVCLHGEHANRYLMPMLPTRNLQTHPDEILASLEHNHRSFLTEGKTFYMKRGEGPFGSLGVDPRKLAESERSRILDFASFLEREETDSSAAPQSAPSTEGAGVAELELGLASTSIPILQMKDSQYCGLLGVGTPPQWFRPIFDTGSTNVWVVGSQCEDDTCVKVRRYNPSRSSSFQRPSPPVHLDITFGTGRIQGTTAVDDFTVGPFQVKQQSFGLVESESGHNIHGNIFKSINFEGIVGMGFPEMCSTGPVPLMDNLLEQSNLDRHEFAFYVSRDAPVSALLFGGVDPRFYEPPIHMFRVTQEHYWEVELDAIMVGDTKLCCESGVKSYAILDSGTSFNTLPAKEMAQFLELVPTRDCNMESDDFLDAYPKITYVISGVNFVLNPEDYLVRSKDNKCKAAYMQIEVPSDYGHAFILGSVAFMRHFFTVFRRASKDAPSMVGIARAVHSNDNKTFLKEVLTNFTSQHASLDFEDELLALERIGRGATLWRREEDRLRDDAAVTV